MAMGILKKLLHEKGISGVAVSSAGTMDTLSHPASEPALMVSAEKGIDISSHRSAPLSDKKIQKADILLAMDMTHLMFIQFNFGHAMEKTFLLCDFSKNSGREIEDPIGMNFTFYQKTFQKIFNCSEAFVDWLAGKRDSA